MATGPKYRVGFKRRKKGKTNYGKRMKLLLSRKARFVARVTNKRIITQLVEYSTEGDIVKLTVDSSMLRDFGWKGDLNNIPASYLTGLLAGKKAQQLGFQETVFDIGLESPVKGSRIFAVLKGIVESGLEIPHNPEVFPDESRVKGEHIAEYYENNPDKFTEYGKKGLKHSDILSNFEETKNKIIGD